MNNRENNTICASFLSLAIAGAMAFSLGAAFVHGLVKQAGIYAAERESRVAACPYLEWRELERVGMTDSTPLENPPRGYRFANRCD